MPIPKIIHQTFHSYQQLPEPLKQNCKAIQAINSDCEHRFYENADIASFIKANYGKDVYDRYSLINPAYGAARADLFRYLCIYACGGIYLDVKADVRKPLFESIQPSDEYILSHWDQSEGSAHAGWGSHPELDGRRSFQQWVLIASPRHPFLAAVIATVLRRIDDFDAFRYLRNSWSAVIHTTGEEPYSKAILDVIDLHPHRVVCMERDFGISYSIFGTTKDVYHHQRLYKSYTKQTTPLIQQPWPYSWLFWLISIARKLIRIAKSLLFKEGRPPLAQMTEGSRS
jgi:mannosyltransferase OCH1-like enzyme